MLFSFTQLNGHLRYRTRLVTSIERHRNRIVKVQRLAEDNQARQNDYAQDLERQTNQQMVLILQTRELRRHIESLVSAMISRPVHIVNDTGNAYS